MAVLYDGNLRGVLCLCDRFSNFVKDLWRKTWLN